MTVRIEREGPLFVVSIDRPAARNAVDGPTATALAEALRVFSVEASARVLILRGEGETFCAGADLRGFAEGRGNRIAPEGDAPMGPSRMVLPKPSIAAIEGHAVAGGLELALLCDLRVVAEDAVMGVFCRRFGVPLIDGGTVRLPRLVGLGRALDLVLTGRPVGATEAHEMGLANRIAPRGQAVEVARQLALAIAAFPPRCMLSDRRSVYEGMDLALEEAMRRELELGVEVLSSGESLEGATRFAAGEGRGGKF